MSKVKDDELEEELNNENEEREEVENDEENNLEYLLKLKENEILEVKDQFLRLQADFVNFRRRAEKERESAMSYGAECLICDILPSIDNFQRALESADDKESGFYKGVELIYKDLTKKLEENGVEEIKALGEDFDPNYHNAIFMEDSEDYEEGKVIEVVQMGYMFKDKVIRPSMVKVAK